MLFLVKKLPLVLIISFLIFLGSCKKQPQIKPEPVAESNIILNEFTNPLILNQVGIKPLIDLDKDGTNDLAFKLSILPETGMSTYYYIVEPLSQNVQLVSINLLDAYAFPYNFEIRDIAIPSDSKRWSGSQGILLEKYVYESKVERIGMFNGSNKLYLGVRIKKGENLHYGWVEIRHEEQFNNDRIIIV